MEMSDQLHAHTALPPAKRNPDNRFAPQKEILITTTAGSLFHDTYLYYIYCTSKGVLNNNFYRGGRGFDIRPVYVAFVDDKVPLG